jgi:hypothetical protein
MSDHKPATTIIEAYCCRLLLSDDAENIDAYGVDLGEVLKCPHCTVAVLTSMTATLRTLFDERGTDWRTTMTDRLTDLLDAADQR